MNIRKMRSHGAGLAIAALLATGAALPGHAQDAAKTPSAPTAPPAASAGQAEAPPPSVARPSLAPKAAETASAPAVDTAPRRYRRSAHRHQRRYAYWQPFPVYWPHVHHHRIYWNRIPWLWRF